MAKAKSSSENHYKFPFYFMVGAWIVTLILAASTNPGITGAVVSNIAAFSDAAGENVGIGTASPQAPLHVKGSTGGDFKIGYSNRGLEGGNEGGNLHIDSTKNMYLNHYTSGKIVMVAGTGGGNVGIGTASPGSKLHVKGGSNTITQIEGTAAAFLRLYTPDSNGYSDIIGSKGKLIFRALNSDHSMKGNRMIIDESGNVILEKDIKVNSLSNIKIGDTTLQELCTG